MSNYHVSPCKFLECNKLLLNLLHVVTSNQLLILPVLTSVVSNGDLTAITLYIDASHNGCPHTGLENDK